MSTPTFEIVTFPGDNATVQCSSCLTGGVHAFTFCSIPEVPEWIDWHRRYTHSSSGDQLHLLSEARITSEERETEYQATRHIRWASD
jgi:hypothetical protein